MRISTFGLSRDLVKSIVRTIRIDEDLNAAIEKLATENRTSVNFIVNSILRENVEWTSIVSKLGFGTYPHYLSITLFDMLTDMECEATGEKIAREFLKPLLSTASEMCLLIAGCN